MSQIQLDEAAIQAAVVQQLVDRYARDPNLRRDVIERLAGYGQPLQLVEKEITRRLEECGVVHITAPTRVQQIVEDMIRRRVENFLTPEQLSSTVGNAMTRILSDAYGKRVKAASKKMVEAAMDALLTKTDTEERP